MDNLSGDGGWIIIVVPYAGMIRIRFEGMISGLAATPRHPYGKPVRSDIQVVVLHRTLDNSFFGCKIGGYEENCYNPGCFLCRKVLAYGCTADHFRDGR